MMNEPVRVVLQDAFVLHCRNFRETSLIADVFSRDFGRLSVLAKGARRTKSRYFGVLQPFRLLKLSWCGRSELLTLTEGEINLPVIGLSGGRLYCGFYLNELLCHFLHRHDPHIELFSVYEKTLSLLKADQSIEPLLRYFEMSLLQQIGYGLQIEFDGENGSAIEPSKIYVYVNEKGLVEAKSGKETIHGSTLIALRQHQINDPVALREARRFLRKIIDYHLGGKRLMSRSFFSRKKHG